MTCSWVSQKRQGLQVRTCSDERSTSRGLGELGNFRCTETDDNMLQFSVGFPS